MSPLSAVVATIIIVIALLHVDRSACHSLKGSVACTDCTPNHDLSGVRVAVKCSNMKKVSAITNEDGHFELDINPSAPNSPDCFAMLLGGPEQLCALKKNMVSKIVKAQASGSYRLSSPLTFYTSCPSEHEKDSPEIGSSKTIGPFFPGTPALPALPPFYFLRFMPIIGIP